MSALKVSDIRWMPGRWILKFKVKGGRTRRLPVPDEVRTAFKEYLKLEEKHLRNLHSDGDEAYLFQPSVNVSTLELNKRSRPGWRATSWRSGASTVE